MQRGEPEAAAEEFLRLAAIPAPESYQYTLRAAEAYIEAGRAAEAHRLLEGAEVPETEPDWSGVAHRLARARGAHAKRWGSCLDALAVGANGLGLGLDRAPGAS